MFIVSIDEEFCTGCGSCVAGCPAQILDFADNKAFVSGDEADCMGCEACTAVCESDAITIMEV